MPRTLSQGLRASIRRPNRSAGLRVRCWFAPLAIALLVASTGCNRLDAEGQPDGRESTEDGNALGDKASASTDRPEFVWPEADDHPRLTIEVDADPVHGSIVIELMPELAPLTVLRVADLAKNGYYDETTFHRVIEDFMIQGGDPNSRDRDPGNDGFGGTGALIDDEFSKAPFERGVVGMANTGRPNSNGGQFFIMHADQRGLDGQYTVIGRVIAGMEIVDAIARVETDRVGRWGPKDRPLENVVMTRVSVGEPRAAAKPGPQGTRGENSDD